jgi:hypothetical protein
MATAAASRLASGQAAFAVRREEQGWPGAPAGSAQLPLPPLNLDAPRKAEVSDAHGGEKPPAILRVVFFGSVALLIIVEVLSISLYCISLPAGSHERIRWCLYARGSEHTGGGVHRLLVWSTPSAN